MTLDIVNSRAAWIDVEMELGGGSRPEVTIVFARKDAVAQTDVFTPYKQYFAPQLFKKFEGAPLPLWRSHARGGPTLGIGSVTANNSEARWVGLLHETAAAADLVAEMQGLIEGGDHLEGSIGFNAKLEKIRTGRDLTRHEAKVLKADAVYDEINELLDMSVVYRGKVPGTAVSLNEAMEDFSRGMLANDFLLSLEARKARLRTAQGASRRR